MRIGVDIDGCLTEQVHTVWEMGTKFCAEKGWECKINPRTNRKPEMFGIDEAVWLEMWCKYGKSWMLDCPMRACAAEVIRKLREEGHEIWIVTARHHTDPHMDGMLEGETLPEATRKWLQKSGIVYDQIAFGTYDKGEYCRENGIEVMIEDDPRYLATFDGATKMVLVFDQPYNQGVEMKNGARVYTWYEIYEQIREMNGGGGAFSKEKED